MQKNHVEATVFAAVNRQQLSYGSSTIRPPQITLVIKRNSISTFYVHTEYQINASIQLFTHTRNFGILPEKHEVVTVTLVTKKTLYAGISGNQITRRIPRIGLCIL